MELRRSSGILLHISSLPAEYGVGDFGPEAFGFVDFLCDNDFSVWQILPLGPIGSGNSPYQAYSAYAGNMLFISPDKLVDWRLLDKSDLDDYPVFSSKKADYQKAAVWKNQLLLKAWTNFSNSADDNFRNEFKNFMNEHNWWLFDYTLFKACKDYFEGKAWVTWPDGLRERKHSDLELYTAKLADEIMFEKFVQFMFFRQWFRLKTYANQKGIQIFGDLPLYVSHDSSDVWANQNIFMLDSKGNSEKLGGVPPDYFSEDGQLWGNPLFDWDAIANNNYNWWVARLFFNFHMFNLVRIDHFRGLESFWAIPADSETAKNGEWLPAKGYELLAELKSKLENLPIVAEDLGIITDEVKHLRDAFNLPGMKVLQFAFASDSENDHLPHNYTPNNVVYTGTHDNDTIKGWWNTLETDEKNTIRKYVSLKSGRITARLIEMAWASVAYMAIVPMQDILDLDSTGRMNVPGVAVNNWEWRYTKKQLRKQNIQFIKMLNHKYNRNNG